MKPKRAATLLMLVGLALPRILGAAPPLLIKNATILTPVDYGSPRVRE